MKIIHKMYVIWSKFMQLSGEFFDRTTFEFYVRENEIYFVQQETPLSETKIS